MSDFYENQSTKNLCGMLAMAKGLGDLAEYERMIDVLRARHPEVQAAAVRWTESREGDLIDVIMKAALAAAKPGSE